MNSINSYICLYVQITSIFSNKLDYNSNIFLI